MSPEQIVIDLTLYIRDSVRPHIGALQSRRVTGTAASGDATFAIDDVAEEAIVQFIEREKLSIAYYSEDKGLVTFGSDPQGVLVIDPIDGTRPAIAGFETCVASVAWADYNESPTMGDVRYGCIAELKQNDFFFAERGKGVRWVGHDGRPRDIRRLPITTLHDAPLSFEAVARPFEYLGTVLGEIVNTASLKGGCFLLNSSAFSITRLLTGQFAGVLDVGNRILRDFPETRPRWIEVGNGKVVALFTYDIAAAALIAQEGGAVVTDAYGRSFDAVPLLDTSEANMQTICAASNPDIYRVLLNAIEQGFTKFAAANR